MIKNDLILFAAQYLFLASFALVLASWMDKTKRKAAEGWIYFVLTVLVTGILGILGGMIYVHARPFVVYHIPPLFPHTDDNSFPSDHTLLTAALAVGLWKISKPLSLMGGVVALLVGIARVLAGVHWPIDIIGSILMALIAGVMSSYLSQFLSKKLHRNFTRVG